MRARSRKRERQIAELPAIRSVSVDRDPVRPEDESFREFVRRLPCVACHEPTMRGDPCHHHTRRRFGDWQELPDGSLVGNLYPACRAHHRDQHQRGIRTFQSSHAIDLDSICRVIGEAYRAGWSTEGLGAAARVAGYSAVDVSQVLDGELPA